MRKNNSNNNKDNLIIEPIQPKMEPIDNSTSTNNAQRPLSLDLSAIKTPNKKQRLIQTPAASTPLVIDSVLKFNTPDLEKFIMANASNIQTTNSNIVFPTKVTSEQEDYAKGFEEALNILRNSDNSQNNNNNNSTMSSTMSNSSSVVSGMSGGSITYTNLDEMPAVSIKDEPQTVPNSPPLSPIDMEDQERIKLERKRQRNRVAASKCRKRKLERISKLEDKVKSLKGENVELASIMKKLKERVCFLKQEVIEHVQAGCTLMNTNN